LQIGVCGECFLSFSEFITESKPALPMLKSSMRSRPDLACLGGVEQLSIREILMGSFKKLWSFPHPRSIFGP
jgi:hypothetical protein